MTDNDLNITYVPMPRQVVQATDALVELIKRRGSPSGYVEGSGDWEVLTMVYKLWAISYPAHVLEFEKQIKLLRAKQKSHGVDREKGGAEIQHQLSIPQKLYQMIDSLYPNQKWDKPFISKLAKTLPMLQAADTTL